LPTLTVFSQAEADYSGYEMPRAAPPEEAFAEPTPDPAWPDEFFVHTVDVGDTLSSIASGTGSRCAG